jgi:hypothetical protein
MFYGEINEQGYITSIKDAFVAGIVVELALPQEATTRNGFRYRYVDGAWTDGFSGVADADVMDAYAVIQTAQVVVDMKASTLPFIKMEAAAQIEATNWKVERATEVDAATGSSTLAAVYAERAAIRTASNTKEAALEALTTYEDLDTFDPADF